MYSCVYVTTKAKKEAQAIAKYLLTKRLVACANIFQINSLYRWKGKLESANEYAMILKTRTANLDSVINEIKSKHSYEVPCLISFAINKGNKEFLDWICSETSKQ
ncbi:MAG: divalent-cation tolerance protein CutA [Candidatus Thermoplasmatota archaeon]|nr:divalent-cation tolerance protein CutA [Candidatus Thermoplasmatota archaeon]